MAAATCGSAAVLALGAGPAVAQDLAYFSTAEAVKQEGTLTVEVDGGSPVACDVEIVTDVDHVLLFNPDWQAVFPCAGGTTLSTQWYSAAAWQDGGGYYLRGYVQKGVSPHGSFWGPGWTGGDEFEASWTNGSGGTPSRVTYADDPLGSGNGEITVSGTLDVTTVSGGAVTLD